MVTPSTGASASSALTAGLDALACELRAIYARAFSATHAAAAGAAVQFETADGIVLDPVFAADSAGCRAVNRHLPASVRRIVPGMRLIERIDEPAVIDSSWLLRGRTVVIEWDHQVDFGDPDGLTVREVK